MSLKTKLTLWYIGSLILLAIFFYIFVHALALPHAIHAFEVLLLILAFIGFFMIDKITQSLIYLASEMKMITSENLDKKITPIKGDDEISDLGKSFNNLLDRLNGAFKREQQFIGDVAHELKTPLATLRSTLEVARSKKRSAGEYEDVLDRAIGETASLSSTLTNVLDLAWTESANDFKTARKFNLTELMQELVDITEKLVANKKIQLEKSIAEDIFIVGYREKLARAVLNIIDNAVKYTTEGTISITLKVIKDRVFILIKDVGMGIKENDLPHIFDRFYRSENAEKISGSGLGLAIAKAVITLHKGTVEVESAHGKGTTFIISLPAI